MKLGQEIETEREKLAQEAANPSAPEKEEEAPSVSVSMSQSAVSIGESRGDMSIEIEVEAAAESVSVAAVESSASVDKVEAPPDEDVKPAVEAAQGAESETKMEE